MDRIVNIWLSVCCAAAFVLLMLAGFGVALWSDAQPSTTEYPGRFLIFAMLALVVAFPAYVAKVVLLVRG